MGPNDPASFAFVLVLGLLLFGVSLGYVTISCHEPTTLTRICGLLLIFGGVVSIVRNNYVQLRGESSSQGQSLRLYRVLRLLWKLTQGSCLDLIQV